MRKEWNAETVKVSSQSMPNLTNIFRIGRDVVKSNIFDDDKESRVVRAAACTTTLSDGIINFYDGYKKTRKLSKDSLIHLNKMHNNTHSAQTEESARTQHHISNYLSFYHAKLPLYPHESTIKDDQTSFHESINSVSQQYDGSYIYEIDRQRYNITSDEELDTTMAACQKLDQEVTRHRHHHVCRFDCNRDGNNIDENEDANDIHQRRSNLRALMIVSTLIGIVSSFFTYLLPFIMCDADKIVAPLLATLFMSAALTSVPIMTTFLPLRRKESNITQGGFPDKTGHAYTLYKTLFIAVGISILILLSFVLLHLMVVHCEFRTMVPIYILTGPFLAIIEISSLSVLIITIIGGGHNEIEESSETDVDKISNGIKSLRQFLGNSKGLSNVLVAFIVIISVFLSKYATTTTSSSAKFSNLITDLHDIPSLNTHHSNMVRNASQYPPFKNSFRYNHNASDTIVSNNGIHQNPMYDGNNNAADKGGATAKLDNKINNLYVNWTRKNDTKEEIIHSDLATSEKYKSRTVYFSSDESRPIKTEIVLRNSPSTWQSRSQLTKRKSNINIDEPNKLKENSTYDENRNTHLKFVRHFNPSNSSENISWHHVLPIWKKVMHNLATNMESNENTGEETQNVIKTWQNTLLGMLAIILFASFFVQLSLLITTFTTITEKYKTSRRKEIMESSFCESSKNEIQYETRRQYYSYCDENNRVRMKNTKIQYQLDCLKKKPFGDKDEDYGFKKPTPHTDSLSHVAAAVKYSYSLPSSSKRSFNGFKIFTFRIKTIFIFYIKDDYLHLIMPMSFFIGLHDGFMTRDFLNGYANRHLHVYSICLVVASMGISRMIFSWISEKMVGSNLQNVLFAVTLGFQCGLAIILYGWVPSSEDTAMFYAISFIWGSTSASWEFLIMWYLNLILRWKENWMVLAASTIYIFHRHLGIATMFGIDTVGILPFDIKNRGYLSFAAFLIAVIPLGVLIRRLNGKWPHAKK